MCVCMCKCVHVCVHVYEFIHVFLCVSSDVPHQTSQQSAAFTPYVIAIVSLALLIVVTAVLLMKIRAMKLLPRNASAAAHHPVQTQSKEAATDSTKGENTATHHEMTKNPAYGQVLFTVNISLQENPACGLTMVKKEDEDISSPGDRTDCSPVYTEVVTTTSVALRESPA